MIQLRSAPRAWPPNLFVQALLLGAALICLFAITGMCLTEWAAIDACRQIGGSYDAAGRYDTVLQACRQAAAQPAAAPFSVRHPLMVLVFVAGCIAVVVTVGWGWIDMRPASKRRVSCK